MARLARLMGVVAKQPFSNPAKADPRKTATGTQREWHLDGALLAQADRRESWQFGSLESLWREQDPGSSSVEDFALNAHHELGIFRLMGRSLRGHICGDPDAAARVSSAVDDIRRSGPFDPSSRQTLLSASVSSLATYLAATVSWLGGPASPLVAAVIFILASKGLNQFCQWTERQDRDSRPADEW